VSVKISVLGSSSSGNCTFIATSQTKILLDAGLNPTQTLKRLSAIGESLDDIELMSDEDVIDLMTKIATERGLYITLDNK